MLSPASSSTYCGIIALAQRPAAPPKGSAPDPHFEPGLARDDCLTTRDAVNTPLTKEIHKEKAAWWTSPKPNVYRLTKLGRTVPRRAPRPPTEAAVEEAKRAKLR